MSEKEAVVEETNASAVDAAVEKRTEDTDLETLLAEFDQGTKKETVVSQPEPKKPAIDAESLAAVKYLEQRVTNEDVTKSVANIFQDIDLDDELKRGWLFVQAQKNPAIEKAFQNRFNDPGTWQRFEKSLAKEAKKIGVKSKVDEDATADHLAVAQAVRGASTKVAAEPPPDLSKMSNAELRKYTQDHWGFST